MALALTITLTAALLAQAETYYFTGTSEYADYTDVANWRVGGPEGAVATTLPGTGDSLYTLSPIYADMAGGDYSVGAWGFSADWDHSPRPLYVRNGTLRITSDLTTHNGNLVMSEGGNIFVEGTYIPGIWDAGAHVVTVNDGCKYRITGSYQLYKTEVTVNSNGEFYFRPTSFSVYGGSAQNSWYDIYGTMDAPLGVKWTSGGLANDSCSIDFRLRSGGLMRLGSGFARTPSTGKLKFSWFDGGTLAVTGAVSFVNTVASIDAYASVVLEVDDGGSIDLSGLSIGTGVSMKKTGVGDFAFENGMTLPDSFVVSEGAVALVAPGSYDLSGVTFDSLGNGKVKICTSGVTIDAWDYSLPTYGGFVSGIASPVAGATVLTCTDASVLALAQAGLNATLPDGFAVAIDGNSLVVTSAYVFNSTTVTDLNDPTGWAGGVVPVGKVVTIMGAGVAPTTTALPEFAGITIQDGASLTIANGGTIPSLALADSAALTISSGTVTLGSVPAISPSGANRPSVTIASGATLNVPGATTFPDCSLSVSGTLATTSAGDLVLGYAAAGDSASFGLTVNGGTLSTSSGDIRFFCPASGGTVTPLGTVSFTGATFSHDDDHGFQFGVNNPTSTAITFTFDNTTLNYPKRGNYYVSGGSALRFVNGGSLYRANADSDNCMFYVNGAASIYLGPGTSSLFGAASDGSGTVGNGVANFSPDADGHVMLTLDSAEIEMYHSAGNSKAVVEVFGASKHPISFNTKKRSQPFGGFKSVNLNSAATLTIENNIDSATVNTTKNYTGAGSLFFTSPRSTTRTLKYQSNVASAAGTLSADPAKNVALAIETNSTWAGTVVWNGKASITHTLTAADAMTFGGIDLASDFTWRIWGDGTCDHYTLTGAGFVDNGGRAVVVVMDGSDAEAGDEWTIARVPATSAVPSAASSAWAISTRAVDGDATVVDLVLAPVATDYVFESDEFTDLCAADGWANGSVPTNQDVKVVGSSTVATISDAAAFPAFASISVRNGATLKVLADVALPPLTVDATSKVVFGDNATQPAVSAVLNAMLTTSYDASVSPVALPVVEIATNATLSVAAGMKFKNVDFRLYGTVTKVGTDTDAPIFGYSENGETSYIAFTADGGVLDFHADNNSRSYGAVSIACPASGGRVIPVGTITLRNAVRNVTGWADFGNWQFGVNNPTSVSFDVLVDGTHIDVSGDFYASGAAHLTLRNGSWIRRNSSCIGHWYPMAIQDAATIAVEDGSYIDFTTNDGSFGIDSQTEVDAVTVRTGGIYAVTYNSSGWQYGVFVSDGGVLGVTKLAARATRTDLLRGFGSARLDGDLTIASIDGIGTGSVNWDRHVKMTDKPFTGSGDVTITNGVPAYPFTVTMVNGANTATGAIKVAKVDGDAETALYFADGANWAGTVVAGNVALTNLTDASSAASASFGTLDLTGDFPFRVWDDGTAVTSDTINVGSYVNNGGKIVPTMMSDGVSFDFGDHITLGTVAKGAALPQCANGWMAKAVPIDGDDDHETVVLTLGMGMQIIVR